MASTVNRKNATAYSKKLRSFERGYAKNHIVPYIKGLVMNLMSEVHRLSPYNMGTLRGSWMVTVNSSGRLPASDSLDDIFSMVERNLRSFTLNKEIAVENDVPYAATYEFGGFEPANPAYREIGGSLALHVPRERRSEKRGKILIVDGYNVVAPQGMVSGGIDYANSLIASGWGSGKYFKVATL